MEKPVIEMLDEEKKRELKSWYEDFMKSLEEMEKKIKE